MKPTRQVSRRSFIGKVTGGFALFGSFGAVSGRAAAQATDADRYITDQPGAGRGPVSGITDKDPGDSVGNGRGDSMRAGDLPNPERAPQSPFEERNERRAGTGVSDSDPTDPVGYGRGGTPQAAPQSPYRDNQENNRHATSGLTDSDPTDPVGDGRGPNAPRPRRCSDADSGPGHDPGGSGRHC